LAKKKVSLDDCFIDFQPKAFKIDHPRGISSGSYMLNIIFTGHYSVGFAYGYLTTLSGLEGSGKTTIGLHAVAEAQKLKGGKALYLDTEQAFSRKYAQTIGMKFSKDKLLFAQPDSGEHMFELLFHAVEKHDVNFILLDSIKGSEPECVINADPGDATVAALSRLFGPMTPKTIKAIKNKDIAVLWLNQIRQKVGVMLGSNEVEPGGNSFRFLAHVRGRIRANLGDRVKGGVQTFEKDAVQKEHTGVKFKIKTEKNRFTDPYQTVQLAIE